MPLSLRKLVPPIAAAVNSLHTIARNVNLHDFLKNMYEISPTAFNLVNPSPKREVCLLGNILQHN